MLRLLLANTLVAALISGCLDADPTDSATPEDATGQAPATHVEFVDCLGWVFVGEVPRTWVEERLPEGYEPIGSIRSVQGLPLPAAQLPIVPPGLAAYRCAEIVLADGTAYHDALFGKTTVALDAAGGHELEDGYNTYTFELFFDLDAMPGLAIHFAPYGWPVHDADLDLTSTSFGIRSSDGIDYAAELGANVFPYAPDSMGPGRPSKERFHVVAGAPSFGSLFDNETFGTTLFSATLAAHGGFFGALGPTEGQAPLAGVAQRLGFHGPSILQWADDPAPT